MRFEWKISSEQIQRRRWMVLSILLFLLIPLPSTTRAKDSQPLFDLTTPHHLFSAIGSLDPLPRIQCPTGYTARIYAEGLSDPDGLAFSPSGQLYVAEETADEISRIESNGSVTSIVTGFASPEGIAFDNAGNLYVVEDVQNGRLIKIAPDSSQTVLATNLDFPEGVAVAADGTVYFTESNIELGGIPQTKIKAISPTGSTTIRDDTPYWSYAGITVGPDGLLYVTNEISGNSTFPVHDSIYAVNPTTQSRTLLTSNLVSPEGLRFGNNNAPLYVAEEDTNEDNSGQPGKLTRVEANGTHFPFCTGFYSIEDVIQDATGNVYVSEDTTGSIIVIEPPPSPPHTSAQAIILFIGDGMGEAYRNVARWSAQGQSGALTMDTLPYLGWAGTASANNPITDSAAAGTALATGVKTNNNMIGQAPNGTSLTTILEHAKSRGMAVGLVTTTQMSHATPASFAAHVPSRNMMTEIASQMIAVEVDVLLGGGEDEFLPSSTTGCYPEPGERTDGRNLINEAIAAGYTYVCNTADFAAVNSASTSRLLGLFADEGMARPFSPSLDEMTQKAIDILSQDPDGFFLMVEGGQIDWAGHANDGSNAIGDTKGFDQAVAEAKNYAASINDTVIIITADHETGGMSVNLQSGQQGPFSMPAGTAPPGRSFYINWSGSDHTGVDVPTTAQGPCADLLAGAYENTHIFDVMYCALPSQSAPNNSNIYLPIVLKAG